MLYPICPTCGRLFADFQISYEFDVNQINNNNKLNDEEKAKLIKSLLIDDKYENQRVKIENSNISPIEKIKQISNLKNNSKYGFSSMDYCCLSRILTYTKLIDIIV